MGPAVTGLYEKQRSFEPLPSVLMSVSDDETRGRAHNAHDPLRP
jgi:hypothetical protein